MSEERKAAERLAVKGIGTIVFVALILWAIPQIWDKLSPFIVAIPLAALLQPVIRFAHDKLKIKRGISTLICVLLLLGLLIGFIGCASGMRTKNTADGVGVAATNAVVGGIVAIAVTDGLLAVACYILEV